MNNIMITDALKLQMKNQKIEYLHSIGRIPNEEYEKWVLCEDFNYEPKIISKEEQKEIFLNLMNQQNIQLIESDSSKVIKLLEEIKKELVTNNNLLEKIRYNTL